MKLFLFYMIQFITSYNIKLTHPSVVTCYDYMDPLYIDNVHLRESRHARLLSLNMNPGNYSIDSKTNVGEIKCNIDKGFGKFVNHLDRSIVINSIETKELIRLPIYLEYKGFYSMSFAYKLIHSPILYSSNNYNSLIVEFSINDNVMYTGQKSLGSWYREFFYMDAGFHVLTLQARLSKNNCLDSDKYCQPLLYCLCPDYDDGYSSFARLGIWGYQEDPGKKVHQASFGKYRVIESVQHHLNNFLPQWESAKVQINFI